MSLSDELQKLRDLHLCGALTNAEFETAKARLLNPGGSSAPPPLPAGTMDVYATPAALAEPPPALNQDAQTRQWAMILHLSQLAGIIVPLAGLVVPIVIWQVKKKDLPGLDVHGCHAANWIITELILAIIFTVLILVFVGVPLLIALGLTGIIFPIIAAIKGSNGEVWRYPLSITFFTPQAAAAVPAAPKPYGW